MESLDSKVLISLPLLLESLEIPNNWAEIPTPSAGLRQPNLPHIAKHIPELDPEAEVLQLPGRDVLRAQKVRPQVNGPHDACFAQCLFRVGSDKRDFFRQCTWINREHSEEQCVGQWSALHFETLYKLYACQEDKF